MNRKHCGTAYLVFRSVIDSSLPVLAVVEVVVDLQIHQASRGVSVALPLQFDDICQRYPANACLMVLLFPRQSAFNIPELILIRFQVHWGDLTAH